MKGSTCETLVAAAPFQVPLDRPPARSSERFLYNRVVWRLLHTTLRPRPGWQTVYGWFAWDDLTDTRHPPMAVPRVRLGARRTKALERAWPAAPRAGRGPTRHRQNMPGGRWSGSFRISEGNGAMARRWGFRAAAILLGMAVPLGVLEAYLRLTGAGGGFYQPDPILGAWHIPNRTGRWRKACFDVPIRINSHGLRDVEHRLEKPSGTVRIAVLGDSIAEALQVPLGASFPRRLEAILNASGSGSAAEVINFGMSGYGTDQMYLSLKTRAAAYRPDVVVLVFTVGNDVRNNYPALERRMSSYPKPFFRLDAGGHLVPIPFEVGTASAAGLLGKIKAVLRHFRTYDFLVEWVHSNPSVLSLLAKAGAVHGVPAPPQPEIAVAEPGRALDLAHLDWGVYLREPDAGWAEAWRVTEALIHATRDEAERMGTRLVLVSIPSPLELATPEAVVKSWPAYAPERYDLAGPRRRLARLAEAEGFDHVSMFEPFAEDLRAPGGKLEDLFFSCDGHLTPRAHQLVAKGIAERLRRPPAAPARRRD